MLGPFVGVGVLILRGNKLLLGRRLGSHGAGEWAAPGGHLEPGETPEACAVRETREETGLVVTGCRRGPFTNDLFTEIKKHYVTLFIRADHTVGEVRVCEPDKCAKWGWFRFEDMPSPLFLPMRNLLAQGWTF